MRRGVLRPLARLLAALVLTGALAGAVAAASIAGLTRSIDFTLGTVDPNQDGLIVVLAIGSDKGPPHRPHDPLHGLADGIHFLVVDPATARMTIINLPRDSWIGGSKVNAHLDVGGPEQLKATVEAWSGLPIDYWALGTFLSIERIAEGLGGMEVEVLQPMNDPFSGTALQPGYQSLGPAQALAFTRDRHSFREGDFARTLNQARLMASVLQQMRVRATSGIRSTLEMVELFQRNSVTNIPPYDVLPLALLALRIPPENISIETITGPIGTIDNQSIVRPQPGDIFDRMRAHQVGPR